MSFSPSPLVLAFAVVRAWAGCPTGDERGLLRLPSPTTALIGVTPLRGTRWAGRRSGPACHGSVRVPERHPTCAVRSGRGWPASEQTGRSRVVEASGSFIRRRSRLLETSLSSPRQKSSVHSNISFPGSGAAARGGLRHILYLPPRPSTSWRASHAVGRHVRRGPLLSCRKY